MSENGRKIVSVQTVFCCVRICEIVPPMTLDLNILNVPSGMKTENGFIKQKNTNVLVLGLKLHVCRS